MGKKVFIISIILSAIFMGCSVDINPGAGAFVISTDSINFGKVYVGDIKQFELKLKNNASADVSVNHIDLEGSNWGNFFITSGGESPMIVKKGDNHSIIVSFNPDSIGSKVAVLNIDYGLDQSFQVDLTGIGQMSTGLVLMPSSYNFGEVKIGESSSVNITLSNGTSNDVTVSSISILGSDSDDFVIISGSTIPINISAQSVHVFTVQFHPMTGGFKNSQFYVEVEGSTTVFTSQLHGEGMISIGLQVTPPNYDYGDVGINSTADAVFTIKNTGNTSIVLTNISISEDLYNNYVLSDGEIVNPVSLDKNEEYKFTISFTPASLGKKTAKFNISYVTGGDPYIGLLTGKGSDQPTLSPSDYDFGSVGLGDSESFKFTFSNPTEDDIDVTNISIAGPDANAFVSDPAGSGPWTVQANGGTLVIEVEFSPNKEGSHFAGLNLTAGASFQALLSGTGFLVPEFMIDPASYDFGSIITGTTDTKAFRVTNNGTGELYLSSVELLNNSEGNFTVKSGGSGSTVQPGTSHLIIIEFSPLTKGDKSTTMRIIHNAMGSPSLINIEGEGADVALIPGNIDFGDVEITTTSNAEILTVKNSTSTEITLTNISISGANASQFSANPIGSINQKVAGNGGTYQFSVTCHPTMTGDITAKVNVVYNLGSLSANLKAAGIEKPIISVSPTSVHFNRTRLGSTSSYQMIAVRNIGTGTLKLETIQLVNNSEGNFGINSGGGNDIKITTGTHYIRLYFEPQSFGYHNCFLRITHNGTGTPLSPLDIQLSGEGYGPEFNLIPDVTTYAFGDCYVNSNVSKVFYISNGGDETLTISSIQLTNTTDFSIRGLNLPVNIAPGNFIASFNLVFTPSAIGNRQTTMNINHNSVNSPKSVAVTGTGLDAPGSIHEDFETNPSTWSRSGDWEWGIPTNTTVPTSAHSGSRCFGTNINGNYSSYSNCYLASPVIDLSKASKPVLTFYMYVYCYTGDGGWVELSTDNGVNWTRNLNPSPAYNGSVSSGACYNQSSGGWIKVTIDLAAAAGKSQVQVAWRFTSNSYRNEAGWYIDTVVLEDTAQPYPYNPVPYDNDINVIPDNSKFMLKWDCDGATSYDVYLSQSNPPTTKIAGSVSTKYYQATVLEDKKYFWKVVANNANGKTTSQVWYFETVKAVPEVLINECDTRSSVDWVEIYNTEDHPVYIGGWELTIYADNNSNPDGTFSFPKGLILQPRQLVVVHDNQASSSTVYRADFNIEWANATSPGEVIFTYPTDYGKKGVDYMKFNTLYNHKPADLNWSGSMASNNTSYSSWYRNKLADTDSSSDWSVRAATPSNKGVANPGQ